MNWPLAQKNKIPFDHGILFKNGGETSQEQLGISKGGGEFSLDVQRKNIDADGLRGPSKGLEIITGITAKLKCSLINTSLDMLYLAMPFATMTGSPGSYEKLSVKSNAIGPIPEDKYFANLTMCAKTVEGKYVQIKLYSVLNVGNVTFAAKPNEEGSIDFEFQAHWDYSDDTKDLVDVEEIDALPTAAE